MPLLWKRGENPYRVNYFGVLEVGPSTEPGVISAKRRSIVTQIQHGTPHAVGGRAVTEAEVNEAESRLMDEQSWAAEVLLVHPAPAMDRRRLQQICRAILDQAVLSSRLPVLHLTRPDALAPLVPVPSADDIPWPAWEEFQVPGPESPEDRSCDIQFDL